MRAPRVILFRALRPRDWCVHALGAGVSWMHTTIALSQTKTCPRKAVGIPPGRELVVRASSLHRILTACRLEARTTTANSCRSFTALSGTQRRGPARPARPACPRQSQRRAPTMFEKSSVQARALGSTVRGVQPADWPADRPAVRPAAPGTRSPPVSPRVFRCV